MIVPDQYFTYIDAWNSTIILIVWLPKSMEWNPLLSPLLQRGLTILLTFMSHNNPHIQAPCSLQTIVPMGFHHCVVTVVVLHHAPAQPLFMVRHWYEVQLRQDGTQSLPRFFLYAQCWPWSKNQTHTDKKIQESKGNSKSDTTSCSVCLVEKLHDHDDIDHMAGWKRICNRFAPFSALCALVSYWIYFVMRIRYTLAAQNAAHHIYV